MTKDSTRFFRTVREYFQTYLPKQRGMSSNTIISYKQAVNHYLNFLTEKKQIKYECISFKDWNAVNINSFMQYLEEEKQVTASTRNQRLFSIRSFLKYARIDNPDIGFISLEAQKISMARESVTPVDFLTETAMAALLKAPGTDKKTNLRDTCFMVVMYDSAARDCEMLSLQVNSFDLNSKTPTVRLNGKGNKVRYVPLMEKTVKHIRRYLELFHPDESRNGNDWFFYTVSHGQKHQMSDDNVARFLKKYAKQAHKECPELPEKVRPHQFRHSRAMHLYRNGMPLQLLSEYMGHASIVSTQIYAYADTEMKRKALEKSNPDIQLPKEGDLKPRWQTDEDMIRELYGLK